MKTLLSNYKIELFCLALHNYALHVRSRSYYIKKYARQVKTMYKI